MTALVRSEAALAWDFRGHWAAGRVVKVVMTERCMVREVLGKVEKVAVTGAFAVVDGWHLPMCDVLRVERALVVDQEKMSA